MSDSPNGPPQERSNKNVALPSDFSARLRHLREERNLSKTDLADAAGTTYRTIQNLETDCRKRAQEKTLMGIAEAFGLTFAELMQTETVQNGKTSAEMPAARGRLRRLWLVPLVVAVLALAGRTAWVLATSHATWVIDGSDLKVSDDILGLQLWRLHTESPVQFCKPAAWDSGLLLVGLGSHAPDGGRLLALDRATGRRRWEMQPDLAQLVRALGEDMVSAAPMSCRSVDFFDVDGDGQQEMLVCFHHGLYHPSAICRVDRTGRLISQYANKGHLLTAVVGDLDADGKDEAVVGGVNNSPDYGGPTLVLLDEDHWRGASIDSLSNPWSSEPDSAAVRMVLPCYPAPFQAMMVGARLYVSALSAVAQANGHLYLNAVVRGSAPDTEVWVQFDDRLRVADFAAKDGFLEHIARDWPDSLKNGTGPSDRAWLENWLAQASYFGAER